MRKVLAFLRPKISIFQKMIQMQLLEILCKRSCSWKFRKFLGKAPVLKCLIKKRLQHGCFPVKLTKFLKTSILKNIRERLLLITIKFIKPNKILSLRSLAIREITRIYHFCYTSSFTCNKKNFLVKYQKVPKFYDYDTVKYYGRFPIWHLWVTVHFLLIKSISF